jgi:hypothetical protein
MNQIPMIGTSTIKVLIQLPAVYTDKIKYISVPPKLSQCQAD